MREQITTYEIQIFMLKKRMESMSSDALENIIEENTGRPDSLHICDCARGIIKARTRS